MENFYRNKDQNWSIFQEQKTFKPVKKKKRGQGQTQGRVPRQ